MNIQKTIAAVLFGLGAASVVLADQAGTQVPNPGAPEGSGLLGKRYARLGFNYTDVNNSRTDTYGSGLSLNLPVIANLDVGVGYSYAWPEAHSNLHAQSLAASAKYYFDCAALKPFVGTSLGYVWTKGSDRAVWGGTAGVEYSLTEEFAVSAAVSYGDDFKKGDHSSWSGTVGANYWLTKSLALTLSTSLVEKGSVGYGAGVAWRF